LIAVTNARSLRSRSFHQPFSAEKTAVTKISLTGVYSAGAAVGPSRKSELGMTW